MPDRLVLNTAGIKSPLDVRPSDSSPQSRVKARGSRQTAPAPTGPPSHGTGTAGRRTLAPTPVISEARHQASMVPKLTSIALDADLAMQLDATARAAGVPANGLAVAALDAGLSVHTANPVSLLADAKRGPRADRKAQRTLPLPERLRRRTDRLSQTISGPSPRTARSELINAALRRGLPDTPQLALALVIVAAT
jgi:hypothetical protein